MSRPAGGGWKRARVLDGGVGEEEAREQGEKTAEDAEEEEATLLGVYRRICSSPSVRAVRWCVSVGMYGSCVCGQAGLGVRSCALR